MIYLRQSTASQEVMLGPFLDSTDGVTPETGLTIANTDILIFKRGASTMAAKNSGGATHVSVGLYLITLDDTDTDTLGSGYIYVNVSGALYIKERFEVLPQAQYDFRYGSTAPSTYAGGDTSGTTTLLSRVTGIVPTTSDIAAVIPVAIKKNIALANFSFAMVDSVNKEMATGLTVTCTRSIDGSAFASGTLANVTEVGNGIYNVDFGAGDLNGDVITLRATATGADATNVTIVTAKI